MKWINPGHEFDALGNYFKQRSRIYIWGCGEAGRWANRQLGFLDCVDAYIDRDTEKQGKEIDGVPVLHTDVLLKKKVDDHLILIAVKSEDNMRKMEIMLQLIGYIKGIDFFHVKDFIPSEQSTIDYKDNFVFRVYCAYAHNKIWLDSTAIFPSTLCTLKCKNCLAFTPYIKQHRIKTLEEEKQEVDVFFKWVSYVRWFQISGGEPQMWPHLCELVDYVGSRYRDRIGNRFEIVTNGTIIPSEDLILLMKKYKMDMVVDDYGDNYGKCKNYSKDIISKLKDNCVEYICQKSDWWFDLGFFYTENTNIDLIQYFNDCAIPFNANEYGRMYLCSYANFAIKAGLIEDDDNEHFDLNVDMTSENIKKLNEFLLGYSKKGYSKLCERCMGWGETINKSKIPAAIQV